VLEHGEDSLCERCDGTGNELLGMYCECEECDGTGVQEDARKDDVGGVRGRREIDEKIEELQERRADYEQKVQETDWKIKKERFNYAIKEITCALDGLNWVRGVRDDL